MNVSASPEYRVGLCYYITKHDFIFRSVCIKMFGNIMLTYNVFMIYINCINRYM